METKKQKSIKEIVLINNKTDKEYVYTSINDYGLELTIVDGWLHISQLYSKDCCNDSLHLGAFVDFSIVKVIRNNSTIQSEQNKNMNIYLLEQDLNNDYDTYDSCVVIAENETAARKIHPWDGIKCGANGKWTGGEQYWVRFDEIDQIKVTLIGTAIEGKDSGVVCASFNAG